MGQVLRGSARTTAAVHRAIQDSQRDGAVAALPDGIAVCQKSGVLQPLSGKDGNRDERYNDGG